MNAKLEVEDVADSIAAQCLGMRVRLIERVVCSLYGPATARQGVTLAQCTLLAAITKSPGVRASDLSTVLVLDRSTLSRNLARLKQLGHVEVRHGQGRNLHHHITVSGAGVLTSVYEDWQEAQHEAMQLMGDDNAALVRRLASTVAGWSGDTEDEAAAAG